MQEFHPVINIKQPELGEKRIILGSFPTHKFTRKSEDEELSQSTGFFYGGERNQFWYWYAEFVDHKARKESVETLKESLINHRIGITDIIYSCERKGVSASDNDLKNRIYNHGFLAVPQINETVKILCTSKGVMNNMLLSPAFFVRFPDFQIDVKESNLLTETVLKSLNHDEISIPVATVLINTKTKGKIEILALPSPGSPFRSLKNFGFQKGSDAKMYLKTYLSNAFQWLLG